MRLRLLALGSVALLGIPFLHSADAASTLTGPDVSKYQHSTGKPIDWARVKRSGQTFAFIKATGGSDRVDPWFAREWAAAGKSGIIRGAYHYADPRYSAVDQARLVVATVGSTREARDLGIVLDLESSGGLGPSALARWAHAFLDEVEVRTGRVPILYTYPNFWHKRMRDNGTFGAYPLWLARYSTDRPGPLPGWDRWTFWQHTSSYHLAGVVGRVDHNVMCCSLATLQALADGRSTAITHVWSGLGGASGQLGLPLGPEAGIPGGWGQSFEKGFVAATDRGAWPVTGPIWDRYRQTMKALGVPVAAEHEVAAGVHQQDFAHGSVVWSAATGAHAVTAEVLPRWLTDGGATSPEGLPTAEYDGVRQQFVHAGLYKTASGVHLVPGAIRDQYEQLGGPQSVLGLPRGEAYPLLGTMAVDFDLGTLFDATLAHQGLAQP